MANNTIAAIDLGSNSFHMIIARLVDGQLQVVDRLREMVQLATGLNAQNKLSKDAQMRALDCLARFGQRLREMPPSRVRIVGTNTLRQARNSTEFLRKAEAVLGHPIEIISGIEEARLIYLGVAHSTAEGEGKRLVVDIGGGSTELIIGEGFEPLHMESLFMGCVSMTRRYFDDGVVNEERLRNAELAVRIEMEPIEMAYRELGWDYTIGTSGTIKTVRDVIVNEGWSDDEITLSGLQQLRGALLQTCTPAAIAARWSLPETRARVFTGGFIVLLGLCQALQVERLNVSEGALREGALYDLLGRIRHEDVRERTIAALTRRYGLDNQHGQRVADTALGFLEQVREPWQLEDERYSHDLEWAARLHEIGLAFAHNQYHKHGAYVLQYSDLSGFSRSEQTLIAVLVRGHRRKFPLDMFKFLLKPVARTARRLCILLRLAVLLHRSRSRHTLPAIKLEVINKKRLFLQFPEGWLDANPMTRADLIEEQRYLHNTKFILEFS